MNEYTIENGDEVEIKNLKAEFMNKEDYIKAHKGLVIPTHDVFIKYGDGILLIIRKNVPAKNILWPIGGRINRGIPIIESLRKKVKEECNLEIENIKELGVARTFFNTDPFHHRKGTDTINMIYYAEGKGKIILDSLHDKPQIINNTKYLKIRETLHPYVQNFMDKAMNILLKQK